MNLGLLSLFVRDWHNVSSPIVRRRCATAAAIVGIVTNTLLSAAKLLVGILTGSIAVTADAVNNFADAASALITLVGFRLAAKPADREHPYGHQRIEYITGLIVSLFILVIGVEFFTGSISAIRESARTVYGLPALIILGASVLVKLWQSFFYRAVGRHIDSAAVMATAADSRNDAVSTAAVLAGALIARLTGADLDGWLGLAVACFIMKSGVELVMETSDPLLGAAPSPELVDAIGKKIGSYPGVLGFHDLVVHDYGPARRFASVHVEVPAERDILESHDLIDNIEFDFRREMGIHLVIHLDPVVTSDEELAELRREVAALVDIAAEEAGCTLTMHDFRIVRGHTHTNVLFDIVVPFECKLTDEALCAAIDAKIRALSGQYHSVITCDRSYLSTTVENKE